MLKTTITVNTHLTLDRLRGLDPAIRREVNPALERGAQEIARRARQLAPDDVYGTLRQSIHAEQVADMYFRVSAGVNYARAVEEGTRPGYWPNVGALQEYIKRKLTRSGAVVLKRSGSMGRMDQEADIAGRAIMMMRSIHAKGTKAHPFMNPAAQEGENRLRMMVRSAVARAANGGGQ